MQKQTVICVNKYVKNTITLTHSTKRIQNETWGNR